jgi:hypothetical protein
MFYLWHAGTVDREPPPSTTLWGGGLIASKMLEVAC